MPIVVFSGAKYHLANYSEGTTTVAGAKTVTLYLSGKVAVQELNKTAGVCIAYSEPSGLLRIVSGLGVGVLTHYFHLRRKLSSSGQGGFSAL